MQTLSVNVSSENVMKGKVTNKDRNSLCIKLYTFISFNMGVYGSELTAASPGH